MKKIGVEVEKEMRQEETKNEKGKETRFQKGNN